MKFSFDSKMVERKITVRQMAPLLWANIQNIFIPYFLKVFCDRWHYFCHEKFALLIKVYMNTTVRQMAPLQQANIGNISIPKCVSVLWQMAALELSLLMIPYKAWILDFVKSIAKSNTSGVSFVKKFLTSNSALSK